MSDNKPFKLYSNEIQLAVSVFDVTIQFKHNTPDDSEFLGSITLSPQHAKVLAKVLNENLAQYEVLFGKINENNEEAIQKLQEQGIIKVGPQ